MGKKVINGDLEVTGNLIAGGLEFTVNIENGSGVNSIQQKTIDTDEPNNASGYESVAFNHETQAVQKACAAFGGGTIAGDSSIENAESTYGFAFAIGEMSKALGRGSFATGNTTKARGMYTSTFGYKTTASKDWQFVVGAMNYYSHTADDMPIPLSDINNALFIVGNGYEQGTNPYKKVVGSDAFAVYKDGHAELAKQGTTNKSVVIKENVTTDLKSGTGARSIIQIHGAQANEATGQSAIALGMGNKATATRAVTIGEGLIGNVGNTTYVGKYNDSSINNTLFVVGNGTSNSARSNAFEVYKDGHAEVGLMGSTNNSVATKQYVDNHSNNKTKLYKHTIDFIDVGGNRRTTQVICNSGSYASKQAPAGNNTFYIVIPNATVLIPIIDGYSAVAGGSFTIYSMVDDSSPFSNCPMEISINLATDTVSVKNTYLGSTGGIIHDQIDEL